MTTFDLYKRVIEGRLRVGEGFVTPEYKASMMPKLDVLMANDRITDKEYSELVAMMVTKPATV